MNPRAQSPFVSAVFRKGIPDRGGSIFEYWSAKKSAIVNQTQAVMLGRADLHRLNQGEVLENEDLWKIFWWGGHRDKALIDALRVEPPLKNLTVSKCPLSDANFGRGYELTGDKKPAPKLKRYRQLPTKHFNRYGPIDKSKFKAPPKAVRRLGNTRLYSGIRLLVKRGITQKGTTKGQIVARLATEPFCFRNSIHGIRLPNDCESEGKILLGIFWSSLARYYYWLTAGSWMWHNEIHVEDVCCLPTRMPSDGILTNRIVDIVDKLRTAIPGGGLFPDQLTDDARRQLERELDEAVFDLYELSPAERDQVADMCKYGLDLFYKGIESEALKTLDAHRPNKCCGIAR